MVRWQPATAEWDRIRGAAQGGATRAPVPVDRLPDPARRFFDRVLPERVPMSLGLELDMAGEIRLGRRWMPFRAEQIICAGVGFVWRPVVGGRILRFVGVDLLTPDDARMEFRWQGRVPVARSSGPDTARSAAGRLAAETVAWLPQALTPSSGGRWHPIDRSRAAVTLDMMSLSITVEVTIDDAGRLTALSLDRWNDQTDPAGPVVFGGPVDSEFVTPDNVRIAGGGRVGWQWHHDHWTNDEFFRYQITSVRPITPFRRDHPRE